MFVKEEEITFQIDGLSVDCFRRTVPLVDMVQEEYDIKSPRFKITCEKS